MTTSGPAFIAASPPLSGGCRVLHLPAERDLPDLTLWTSKPETEQPAEGWPTLILLDGEAYFTATAEMAQRLARRSIKTRIGPIMIVAVVLTDAADRHAAFNFLPVPGQSETKPSGQQLLRRLSTQVLPLIEAEGANLAELTLMGHSMSGLFTLEARAAAAPFARYVAISPSIWSNPSVVAAQPQGSRRSDDLLVIVGGQEETPGLSPAHLARHMVSNARRLLDQGGVSFSVLTNEDHGSTPYASLPATLRFTSQR